jgi:outer membrane protein assembly factor BamB
VVAYGAAFFMDDEGTLYALDAHTGALSWTWRTDDPGWSTAWVGIAGDVVLQGIQENEVVHAGGRTDGVHPWTLHDRWYPTVVDDQRVVVGGDTVRAVELATRAARWSARVPIGTLGARPASGDGLVVVTGGFEGNHSHGGAIAVDLATGAVRWTRSDEWRAHGVQEKLYVTVHPAHAALADGLVWLNRDLSTDRQTCELVALDPVSGEVRSAVEFEATIAATPLLAGGVLHVATDDGQLHGVDGSLLWSVSVDDGEVDWPAYEGDEYSQRETPFVLVDGVAYVRNGNSVSALT